MSMTTIMTMTVSATETESEATTNSELGNNSSLREKMDTHFKKMEIQMQAIHSESDLERRKQLMQGHRQSIREGMKMMMQDDGDIGVMGRKKEEIHAAMKREGKMEEYSRVEGMEAHLDMMQQMMEQMMQHQNEAYELYETYRDLGTNLGS